jgi:TIR domain
MDLLGTLDVPLQSNTDETRRIELFRGDIAAIPDEHAVDLVVVSAFPDDYMPLHGTVIQALHRVGVSLARLSRDKAEDMRPELPCWLSKPIPDAPNFSRVLCFEPFSSPRSAPIGPRAVVGDIFRSLVSALDTESPWQVAMPLVATGSQREPVAEVMVALIESAVEWMQRGLPISTLKIIAYQELHAREARGAFVAISHLLSKHWQPVGSKFTHDIFLSYAHADSVDADILLSHLQALRPNIRVFRDTHSLKTGIGWQHEIFSAIDDCRFVVPLLSPSYIASKNCIDEYNVAWLRQKTEAAERSVLQPLYLRTANLPTYMKAIQWRDCREAETEKLQHAAQEIVSLL